MQGILDFFSTIGDIALPIFVFFTMLNVGMTQTLKKFSYFLKEWPFYVKMLVVSFIVSPLIAWLLLQVFNIPQGLAIGIMIFSMSAGAPFLIKLTQYSEHSVALGASLMVVLIFGTSIFVPIALPILMPGVEVDAWNMFLSLAQQMILPIILGLLIHKFFPDFNETVQPYVGKIGGWALNVVVVSVLVGNLPGLIDLIGQGAIAIGLVYVALTGLAGYFSVKGAGDHWEDIGLLGSAQRNTAAAMLIASNNFSDQPEVLLIITLINQIALIILIQVAKKLSEDNMIES